MSITKTEISTQTTVWNSIEDNYVKMTFASDFYTMDKVLDPS